MRMGGADGYGDVFVFTARHNPFSGATTVAVTPRLADNESVLAFFPGVILRIRGADAGILDSGTGGYPGKDKNEAVLFVPKLKKGTLFITSQRIVFLRREIDWKAGYLAFKEGVRAVTAPDMTLSRVLACGGLEYCEISLGDIARLDRNMLGGKLRIETHGRVYVLGLTRKQAEAVARLMGDKRGQ